MRLSLIGTVALGTLAVAFATSAQQPSKVFRMGALAEAPLPGGHADAFRRGLRELGYVEGQNTVIEWRYARGSDRRYATVAADLIRLEVDMILAISSAALTSAARATKTIPIVAIDFESDPVESGFAASLSRPGGNITGLFLDGPELMGKWLELLKEITPGLSRVLALWDPATGRYQLTAAHAAARSLGVQLETREVTGPEELDRALVAAIPGRPGALIQLSSALIFFNSRRIGEFALRHRLPAISMFREFPEVGGLIAYGPNLVDLFERCGMYAARILNGAKPGQLPIERPAKLELVINLKTAKTLGLTIPYSVLVRADEVIR